MIDSELRCLCGCLRPSSLNQAACWERPLRISVVICVRAIAARWPCLRHQPRVPEFGINHLGLRAGVACVENTVRIVSFVFLLGVAAVLGIASSWVFPLFIITLTAVISLGLYLQEYGTRMWAQLDRSDRRTSRLASK